MAVILDKTFFLQAMTGLSPALAELGFELAVEHYDYLSSSSGSSGTAYAEYRRRGLSLRVLWDGKEQALRVETSPPTLQSWTNVETGAPPDRTQNQARLDRLATLIRARFPQRR